MGKSSKVMTPRNVELPTHVILAKKEKPGHPKKKCLCLTLWLFVLLLLCVAVVIIAHFLLPQNLNQNLERLECLETAGVGLEQKTSMSDLIVVGTFEPDPDRKHQDHKFIRVERSLKGVRDTDDYLPFSAPPNFEDCLDQTDQDGHDHEVPTPKVYFLTQFGDLWIPRFQPMLVSDKLTQVIRDLLENSDLVTNEQVEPRSRRPQFQESSSIPLGRPEVTSPSPPSDPCSSVPCQFGGKCMIRLLSRDQEPFCSCENLCDESDERIGNFPVCGTDHVTYRNSCELKEAACGKQQNITMILAQQCEEASLCGPDPCPFNGVCARNYEGRFECQCQECYPENQEDFEPVCGSDNVQYASECDLRKTSCQHREEITVKKYGKCETCKDKRCGPYEECIEDTNGNPKCVCQKCSNDPAEEVCGSDGITYFSLCHLQRASCTQGQDIYAEHYGACDPCNEVTCKFGSYCSEGQCICRRECPDSYEPICASNGKTYFNYCFLEKDNCARQHDANFEQFKVVESRVCHEESPHCDGSICECPDGVKGPLCNRCKTNYWAFTSFGCKECKCNQYGAESMDCNAQTGICPCKRGFSGDHCEICPDGTLTTESGCISVSSTKYDRPIPCGESQCNYGATCSNTGGRMRCICEIDCRNPLYYREAVCGTDGNTYRSECQLRQNSCRKQTDIAITNFAPCKDAPDQIYGQNKNPRQVLSDQKPSTGQIGETCLTDSDCIKDNTKCSLNRCICDEYSEYDKQTKGCKALKKETTFTPGLCDPNPCHGGGTCEEHDGVFTCYCPPGFAGTLCQHDLSKSSISVASFIGNTLMAVKTPVDSVNRLEIKLKFRTFAHDGLILYNEGNIDNGETDFLSLAIVDRYVEFRYDLGSGPVVLRSNSEIVPGQWHELVAKRYHHDGLLEMDGDKVMGSSKGSLRTLNVGELLWIGNVDTKYESNVLKKVGTAKGFTGCLKDLLLSRKPVALQSEQEPMIMQRKNVVDCEENPCVRMPCNQEGSCSVKNQGFECECPSEFTGRRCQRKRNQCHPNPCKNKGQCKMNKAQTTFTCSCQTGFFGRLCEDSDPESSWERYRKSTSKYDRQKLSFGIQTNLSEAGELFTVPIRLSNNHLGHLTLSASEKGHLVIKVQDEGALVIGALTTDLTISDGNWHRINILRQDSSLNVHLDGERRNFPDKIDYLDFISHGQLTFGPSTSRSLCLRHYILKTWKNNRHSKTNPVDICK
ncbi:agrin-like [Tigriopus californicus]|uniref:agrin-like n=1 Tax=Tigriopus californicus TaxID=6832 RepID=UPI0027D9D602|nr:agrin-like [Tigriopus californicus]